EVATRHQIDPSARSPTPRGAGDRSIHPPSSSRMARVSAYGSAEAVAEAAPAITVIAWARQKKISRCGDRLIAALAGSNPETDQTGLDGQGRGAGLAPVRRGAAFALSG